MEQSNTIINPVKYLKINLQQQVLGDCKYSYFIAEKKSYLGIIYHTRFFFLIEDNVNNFKTFGYARDFPKDQKIPFQREDQIPLRKIDKPLDEMKVIERENNKQIVKIIFQGADLKNVVWELKCQNNRMAQNVYTLLDNAKTASIQKVVHYDMVNQTVNTLVPGKHDNKLKVQADPNNPFSINNLRNSKDAQQNTTNLNQQISKDLGNSLNSLIPVTEDVNGNQTVNLRSFTLSGNPNNNGDPLNKPSLVSVGDENQREKQEFIRKIEEQKAKQQGTLSKISISSNARQLQGNVTEDFIKLQSDILQKRQDIIQKDNQLWNYQFLKGNEQALVLQFKNFSENLICKMIDELCLPQSQRSYTVDGHKASYDEYNIQKLNIRLYFTGIAEMKRIKNTKETVYDESSIKAAYRQFKNMDYLMSITRNKGKVRLPLANIVQYKGIVALVKADIEEDQRPASSFASEFDLISREARIKKQVFADPLSVAIRPLDSKRYQKNNRLQSPNKRSQHQSSLQIVYLDEVKHFLPADFNYVQKDSQNFILRPQLLQHEDLDGMQFMGIRMEPFFKRSKTQRGIQQSIKDLQAVSQKLKEAVNNLIEEWEGLQQIAMSSKEVQRLFHKHGVNMRYLGMVYDKSSVSYIRNLCMYEMSSRAAKIILRARMQQVIQSYSGSLTPQQVQRKDKLVQLCECNQYLLNITLDFLNDIISNSGHSSESVWKIIIKQVQYNFGVSIPKPQIIPPYFLQTLILACNIKFDWTRFPRNVNQIRGRFFRKDMILGFNVKSKNYNLNFTDLYTRINALLDEDTPQNFQQIKSLLNLRKQNIPDHFKLNGMYEKLAILLSDYIEPKSLNDSNSNSLPCTTIYNTIYDQPPSYTSICLAIKEIKWVLKRDNINKAHKLYKQLIERMSGWYGEKLPQPALTELYSMLAQYYSMKGQYEQALNYSKSALANESKILGGTHQKIAQRYYELGQIAFKASKKQESYSYYLKAKNICDNINQVQEIPYAEICYKLAILSLELDKLADAESSCREAVRIFQMNKNQDGSHEKQSVECYELLMRIYEVWALTRDEKKIQEMQKISLYCGKTLSQIKDNSNLQKMIKIFLISYLNDVKKKQADRMLFLFQQIPLQSGSGSYSSACKYLKKLVQSQSLFATVQELFDNFGQIYTEVIDSSLLTRWRGFQSQGKSPAYQCISLVEALIYFLGSGFVLGSLMDK